MILSKELIAVIDTDAPWEISDDEIIIITAKGKIIRQQAGHIRKTISRGAQGVKLMDLGDDDEVAAVTRVPQEDDQEFDE